MGWTPPPRRLVPLCCVNPTRRGHPKLAFLAKRSFSLHGPDGSVAFRRSRLKVLHFLEQQAKCIVEACGSYRGREKLGHEVRLLPPVCVKPFVKRERRGGRGRRSRVPPDVRRREDRGTAGVAGAQPGGASRSRVRHCGSAGRCQRQEACVAGISRPARSCAPRPLKQVDG